MGVSVLVGFLGGLFVSAASLGLAFWRLNKRSRLAWQAEVDAYEAEVADLRRDQTADRENNRRLRRELAINTPDSLAITRQERDQALDELDQLTADMRKAAGALVDRDSALREARIAIHDIRVQLERERVEVAGRAAVLPMVGAASKAQASEPSTGADEVDDDMYGGYSMGDATAS